MHTCAAMLFVGFYVNTTVYPVIVSFKGQIKAAEAVNNTIPREATIYSLRDQNNIFQFYCDRPVKLVPLAEMAATPTEPGAVFYADQEAVTYLTSKHVPFNIIWYGTDYAQENILPAFINSDTRGTTLQNVFLIKRP